MVFESVLTYSYSLVPIIYVCGYGPQLRSLYLQETKLENFPFATWFMWLVAATVSGLYGHMVVSDTLITVSGLSNVFPIMTVMLYAAYKAELFIPPRPLYIARRKIDTRVNHHIDEIADQMHNQGYEGEYVQGSKHNWVVAVDHAFIAQESKTIQ